jgi:hypothetical protein
LATRTPLSRLDKEQLALTNDVEACIAAMDAVHHIREIVLLPVRTVVVE